MGDIVHTLPAIHDLRCARPHSQIVWVANTEWTPLLKENPDVSKVIEFPRSQMRGVFSIPTFLQWAKQSLPKSPDVALDFQGLLRTVFMAHLSNAKRIIGLNDAREGARWLFHERVATREACHSVARYRALAAACTGDFPETSPTFFLPAGRPPPGFNVRGPFIALHPFSRGQNKSLALPVISRLADALRPHQVVLLGRAQVDTALLPDYAINLLNATSLTELIWVLRNAACVISVDSGPMHLAAALNDHVLGIHSWSDPRLVGPFNPAADVWQSGEITPMKAVLSGKWKSNPGSLPETGSVHQIAQWTTKKL
jgi:ADP-heptose:LPS heptosyltransferase